MISFGVQFYEFIYKSIFLNRNCTCIVNFLITKNTALKLFQCLRKKELTYIQTQLVGEITDEISAIVHPQTCLIGNLI